MSRSAVVGIVTALVLMGAAAVVTKMHWAYTGQVRWWLAALGPALGILGANLVAVSLRRIIDPKLDWPLLVLIAAGVFVLVFMIMSAANKKDDDTKSSNSSSSLFSSSSSDDKPRMGLAWAITSTIGSLGVYAGGLWLTIWLAQGVKAGTITTKTPVATTPASPAPSTTRTLPTTPAPSTPAPPPPQAPRDIIESADLAAAIAFAKPNLTDTRDAPSRGAKLLARYAAAKLRIADVAVAKNETSLELVEKDPMAQVGKRLCVAGTLLKIEKQAVDGTDVFSTRIVTKTGDLLEAFAVGETGKLVKRSPAKFCGVVTGRVDVGGKSATFAVGMFDLGKR